MTARGVAAVPILIALAAGAAVACYWAVVLSLADAAAQEGTWEGLSRAARLVPQNTEYPRKLAALSDDPLEAARLLSSAAARNRYDAAACRALALLSESRGDVDRAEAQLIRANAVDRTSETSWVTAQFYHRRGNIQEFWRYARTAAENAHHNDPLFPLFRFCSTVESDVVSVRDRLMPERIDLQARYVAFLINQNRAAEADLLAERLVPKADETHRDLLGYAL